MLCVWLRMYRVSAFMATSNLMVPIYTSLHRVQKWGSCTLYTPSNCETWNKNAKSNLGRNLVHCQLVNRKTHCIINIYMYIWTKRHCIINTYINRKRNFKLYFLLKIFIKMRLSNPQISSQGTFKNWQQ